MRVCLCAYIQACVCCLLAAEDKTTQYLWFCKYKYSKYLGTDMVGLSCSVLLFYHSYTHATKLTDLNYLIISSAKVLFRLL